jgi:hypothetical protein
MTELADVQAQIEGLFDKYYPKKKKFKSDNDNTVTLVKKVTIKYNLKKLKRALKKLSIETNAIRKTVTVIDVSGLIEYVKSLGGDPKVFKSFLEVEEIVDSKAIDALYEDGSIDYKKDIKPCIDSVKIKKHLR